MIFGGFGPLFHEERMPKYDYIHDFWDRLPMEWVNGVHARYRDGAGRTDEQLDAYERLIGFPLPALFREQYKVQNGGYPKRECYREGGEGPPEEAFNSLYEDGAYYIFVNDSHLWPLTDTYYTFREYLNNFWSDEEIAENLPDWDIDKLVIISPMWGHSTLCLDYGYRESSRYDEPQVVCINDEDFEEELRVESYERFVAGLVVDPDDED